MRKPRDSYNFWAAAGAGTPASLHPHLTSRPLLLPLLPSHPPTLERNLSKWDTGVKAAALSAPSARGAAHHIHTERAPTHVTAAALQDCLGEKRTSHVQTPACTPLHRVAKELGVWVAHPELSGGAFPSGWGRSTSLPYEPAQRTNLPQPSCPHCHPPHTLPGSLASDRTPGPALQGLLPPPPRAASSSTVPTGPCTCLSVTWHV